MVLLNAFKNIWQDTWSNKLFFHVSTDEVYGTLGQTGLFTETTPYDPNSPYSASKASSDHIVRSYGETYNMPYVITNCSNNYGPYHFPEKLIPHMILNCLHENHLPIYVPTSEKLLLIIQKASICNITFHSIRNSCPKMLVWKSFLDIILQSKSLCSARAAVFLQ